MVSDPEQRERRQNRRRKNRIAKILYDPNEYRGAFSLRVHEDKKSTYHRNKLRVRDIVEEEEYENEPETTREDS